MFKESCSLLTDIVDSMLPRFSGQLALRFRLRMDQDYYGEKLSKEVAKKLSDSWCVEFVVHRPSNYTKVYMRQGPFGSFGPGDKEERGPWMFVADHDSCWREAFDKPCRISWERRQPFLDAGLEPHEVAEYGRFDMFDGQPQYVELEKAEPLEPVDRNERWRLRKVPHQLTFKRVPLHRIHTYLRAFHRENSK
jgi:hypothetical protein